MPRAGGAGGGIGTRGWASAATNHTGDARHQGFFNLLWANKMDMGVNTASGHNHPFRRNNFGRGTNHNIHSRLNVWVTRFANRHNAALFQANVRFNNSPMVKN